MFFSHFLKSEMFCLAMQPNRIELPLVMYRQKKSQQSTVCTAPATIAIRSQWFSTMQRYTCNTKSELQSFAKITLIVDGRQTGSYTVSHNTLSRNLYKILNYFYNLCKYGILSKQHHNGTDTLTVYSHGLTYLSI